MSRPAKKVKKERELKMLPIWKPKPKIVQKWSPTDEDYKIARQLTMLIIKRGKITGDTVFFNVEELQQELQYEEKKFELDTLHTSVKTMDFLGFWDCGQGGAYHSNRDRMNAWISSGSKPKN